jgi:hypothetical protein
LPSLETQPQKLTRDYDTLIELKRSTPKREDSTRVDKKLMAKKPKIVIDNFREFLPEFLILLNQQKHRSIIRIGRDYQANIPKTCAFSFLYRPLSHLKVWNAGEIQAGMLKKFRDKFGENRNEEELCMLLFQYQCDWDHLGDYISEYKGELKKIYVQRDRTKT